ncbi:hypothetical protein HerbRD11066_60190 [Herbidospora sp. RD11066]
MQIDPDRKVTADTCDCCGTDSDRVTGFINNDDSAYAIYFANCYHHDGVHEAWIDVILDDAWDREDIVNQPSPNRVTFGCRVGPIEGHPAPMCSLVAAASVRADEPLYGRKLDREAALGHPWLADYWQTVDHILENDATIHRHLYGPPAS